MTIEYRVAALTSDSCVFDSCNAVNSFEIVGF